VRLTISVDCDPLGSSPRERVEAACKGISDLLVSLPHGVLPDERHEDVVLRKEVPGGGRATISPASHIVFRGTLRGEEVRVRRLSGQDLVVERYVPALREAGEDEVWAATDDEDAMLAYELCIRSLLGDA
jgi:hypothetical protein